MSNEDFMSLKDRVYEFRTYMNEVIVGIPYWTIKQPRSYFVLEKRRMRDFNNDTSPDNESRLDDYGRRVNPSVIDDYEMLEK